MANFISHEFELPSHWAPYLINNDDSSLELDEINTIDQLIKDTGLGFAVSVSEDTSLLNDHDALNYGVLASNCATYSFLEQVDDLQPEPSLSAADRNPSMLR